MKLWLCFSVSCSFCNGLLLSWDLNVAVVSWIFKPAYFKAMFRFTAEESLAHCLLPLLSLAAVSGHVCFITFVWAHLPWGLPLLRDSAVPWVLEVFAVAKLWIPKHQFSHQFLSSDFPRCIRQRYRWTQCMPVSLWWFCYYPQSRKDIPVLDPPAGQFF